MSTDRTIGEFQEAGHGPEHDYVHGSPHLEHPRLRAWLHEAVVAAVRDSAPEGRAPRVLEVGAGHGTLTGRLVEAGAEVVVTEMSGPSAATLRRRFADVAAVEVVHDPSGDLPVQGAFDAVVAVAVLHHIPDYLAAVTAMTGRLRAGGTFVSFQDPLWYPRRTRPQNLAAKAIYLAWRLGEGELRRGVATQARQLRGIRNESEESDMVEYHVMRDGVDERALAELLAGRFASIELVPYWSTQAGWGQRLGERWLAPNTFGVVARGAS